MGPLTQQFVDELTGVVPAVLVELAYDLYDLALAFQRWLLDRVGDLIGSYQYN